MMDNSSLRDGVSAKLSEPCGGALLDRTELLRRVLDPKRVRFLDVTTKDAALRVVIDAIVESSAAGDKSQLTQAVFDREALMSTGIGLGLAVPHVRLASVQELVMAVGVSREGIRDYVSLDEEPVHVVILIAAPEGQHAEYLRLLSAISFRAKTLKDRLLECTDAETLCEMLLDCK
jgi:mannitol/fructose-specific phosphotransferase system IIA component (Ntr-type)